MSKDNGGPAYPVPGDQQYPEMNGMSLRDWFAGQAMTAFIAPFVNTGADLPRPDQCARWCYQYADAMVAERAKKS